MALPAIIKVASIDLFAEEAALRARYPDVTVQHVLRLRDLYNWYLSNPDSHDRQFIETAKSRYNLHKTQAYEDLSLIKRLLPIFGQASRDFHRWRANEMLIETYRMAKARKDTKTMEKAASSYAKYNRVDVEDEQAIPYDDIVIQPYTATMDPRGLGLNPIPNLDEEIDRITRDLARDCRDIEDIDYEAADIEESSLFGNPDNTQP